MNDKDLWDEEIIQKLEVENQVLSVNVVLLENKVRQHQSTILELQERTLVVGKLEAENKKLREALEFYANQTSWMGYHRSVDIIARSDCEPAKALSDDFDIFLGGKRAREALKEVGEE
jgi:hypothetical protein